MEIRCAEKEEEASNDCNPPSLDAYNDEVFDILGKMAKYLTRKPKYFPRPPLGRHKRHRLQRGRRQLAEDAHYPPQSCKGLAQRNWVKVSVDPFINFLRTFRKFIPKDCPVTVMQQKGRLIWKKMPKERKQPYFEQAKRAKEKGYRM